MLAMPLHREASWIELWNTAIANSPLKTRGARTEQELVERWNTRAAAFEQHRTDTSKEQTRNRVLVLLNEKGALQKGDRVLDIGAGSGNYAISIAAIASEVTVVEPAEEMVKRLVAKIETNQITNITIIQKTWQDITMGKELQAGQYDLAFASMTPGVRDPDGLFKMISASRRSCYFSTHAGQRWGFAKELWRQFFNEDMGDNPGDIIYPFGLLYAMDYKPELLFFPDRHPFSQPAERVIDNLVWFFSGYLDVTPEKIAIIERYVKYQQETHQARTDAHYSGALLWHINLNIESKRKGESQ